MTNVRRLFLAALGATALAIGACGGGNGSSGGSPASTPQPSASASTVTFTETEFKIDTASTSLKAGDYTFQVENKGQFPHDLHIATPDGSEVAKTDVINAGGSATVQVTLKAGTYTIWCAVDSHKARGMQGTLTVT
jgi:plastocyanin